MSQNIYKLGSYTEVIRAFLATEKHRRGLINDIAKAIPCQQSHISRVLGGDSDLSMDQAAAFSEFMGHNDAESEYFLSLVQLARAGTLTLKTKVEKRLTKMRKDHEDQRRDQKVTVTTVSEIETLYFSAWHWSAIHLLLTVSNFQTAAAISERLGLPVQLVLNCLQTLEQLGLVQREGASWKHSQKTIFLSRKSPLASFNHANWRHRATLASQMPIDDHVHFTVVQSISQKDYLRIKQLILDCIDSYQAIANPSKEEDVLCFCLDLFRI